MTDYRSLNHTKCTEPAILDPQDLGRIVNKIVSFELRGNVVSSEMASIFDQLGSAKRVSTHVGLRPTRRLGKATLLAEARRLADGAVRRGTGVLGRGQWKTRPASHEGSHPRRRTLVPSASDTGVAR